MGRKATITQTQLLDAGLAIIQRHGYAAVSITSVAQELGCSTQPIAWCFGSFESYRVALRRHATEYMQRKMLGQSPADAHGKVGYTYIDMAIDQPDLIRYLRSDEPALRQSGGIAFIFDEEMQAQRRTYWAEALGVSEKTAEKFITFSTLLTEGIVSMLLSGVLPPDRQAAYRQLEEGSTAYAIYLTTRRE